MKVFIKKYGYNILVFTIFLFLFGISNYFSPISNLDELWKYNHSKALLNGAIPYKDLNLITTPFYFFLTMLFLVPNSTLIMFRIYSCFFNSLLFFLFYLILKNKTNKNLAFVLSILSLCLLTICDAAIYIFDYNRLFLLIVFVCIFWEIKTLKKNNNYYFILGFLYALLDLTKQSTGFILFLLCTLYIIVKERKSIKNILIYILGFFIPNFVFLAYLLVNNIFYDFFDYCLFGLNGFSSNKISFFYLFTSNLFNFLSCIIVIFSFVFLIISVLKNKNNTKWLFYFISICFLAYPICDSNHFALLFLFSIISDCLLLNDLLKDKNANDSSLKLIILQKRKFWFVFSLFLCLIFYLIVYVRPIVISNEYVRSVAYNTKSLFIKESLEKKYIDLNNYIEENHGKDNVLLVSSNTVVISIFNDTSSGVFDVFLNGNLGTISGIQYIETAMSKKTIICISDNYKEENWQNINDVYDYIVENYECIDKFNGYSFYQKNVEYPHFK